MVTRVRGSDVSTVVTGSDATEDPARRFGEASHCDHADGVDARDDHQIGDLIADRYELGPVIGRGGSATVYRAWDRTGERPVALKWYPAGVTGPDRFRQDQELRALSGLDHPGLVSMLDAGTEDEHPYLVMVLVDGPSLTERLDEGPLPAAEVVEIGRHLASALRYVHAHGITHRDVKPANVLLDDGRRPLLADFGIALVVDTTRVTTSEAVVGTAAYLAPEQVRGEDIGTAADIYALGLVLLESITGMPAYPGTSTESVVARLHHAPVVPRDLPGGFTALLEHMTCLDAARRPDARGVVGELAAVADRIDGSAGPAGPDGAEPAETTGSGSSDTQPASSAVAGRRRRRRALVLSAAGVAAFAVVGGVLAWTTLGRTPEPTVTPAAPVASAAPAAPAPRASVAVAPPVIPDSATPQDSSAPQASPDPQAGPDPQASPDRTQADVPAQQPDASPPATADGGAGDGWNQGGWNQGGWNQGGWNQGGGNQGDWNQSDGGDPGATGHHRSDNGSTKHRSWGDDGD